MELDFEIDKITNSIEDAKTGEVLKTLVLPLEKSDLKDITKKNGWLFDWKFEFSIPNHKIYKLVTVKEPKIIQGLVSPEKDEGFVYMHLIENAPFNRGKDKKYLGVACNLTAYGCKLSLEYGFGGVICYEPKTALIPHYEKMLGAVMITKNRMAVFEESAMTLIKQYFPESEV